MARLNAAEAAEAAAALRAALQGLAQGDFAAARERCGKILDVSPNDAAALHVLGLIAHRDGARRQAEDCLRRAAESPDTNALYLLSYAELCCKSTDPAAAIALTRRALAFDGEMALGWFSLGSQLLAAREYAESRDCLERALELDAGLWQARSQLAIALGRDGHTLESLERFRLLLSEHPHNSAIIADYALLLQDLGRYEDALGEIERAIELAPDTLDHHLRAADIEVRLGRHARALDRLHVMKRRWTGDPALCAFEAMLLTLHDRHEEAIELCREALRQGLESADLLRAYAGARQLAGEFAEALALLDRAAETSPAAALVDKGILLGELGRLAEANAAFDRALRHEPTRVAAWYNRTNTKKYAAADPDIEAMQRILDAGCSHHDRMLLHFALGKAHVDAGDMDSAFANWHAGNRMKRAAIEYDADATARHLESISATPVEIPPQRLTGASLSEVPVFIVGMPRSGSSLVEQIVASHPDVHGSGERNGLFRVFAARRLAHDEDELTAESVVGILRRRAPPALRIVDKDLRNFEHLGVIHRIFPQARIIHCRRDALDTCFSAYTKLFLGDFAFTYDLRELGLYYRSYQSLMEHWRAVLPSRAFIEVDYERLVAHPRETSARIVDFLGLPWNEDCLRFFETTRAVRTSSLVDVRRPIYHSSVGRSAAARTQLEVLIETLSPMPVGPK
jgi:tetratricopeptide (TPR) repeat protein